MSYVRFGERDSDVYVYEGQFLDGRPYLECCGCRLAPLGSTCTAVDTADEMREHLQEHLDRGDCVPIDFGQIIDPGSDWELVAAENAAKGFPPPARRPS